MKDLLDNLDLFEIVLLFLGAFLFLLLCGALVYFIVKKEEIKKLLWFFPIPIIMMGYPSIKEISVSIKEIKIEKERVALKEQADNVITHPDDTIAQKELMVLAEELEKKASSTEDYKLVAETYLLLGKTDKAINLTNRAVKDKQAALEELKILETTSTDSLVLENKKEELMKMQTIQDIKEIAETQKEISKNPSAIKDTVVLKQKISRVNWENPKSGQFLRKRMNTVIKK
ncbi:hypothetical protein [Aquimarina agarilytica]|uniref:hypothetical protein n=1 Tax=Aquimarina agarilytica TaxID=1087449 RepID=UPI0002893D32|nr:hypothetical protein [Aquimarina agarilytica]